MHPEQGLAAGRAPLSGHLNCRLQGLTSWGIGLVPRWGPHLDSLIVSLSGNVSISARLDHVHSGSTPWPLPPSNPDPSLPTATPGATRLPGRGLRTVPSRPGTAGPALPSATLPQPEGLNRPSRGSGQTSVLSQAQRPRPAPLPACAWDPLACRALRDGRAGSLAHQAHRVLGESRAHRSHGRLRPFHGERPSTASRQPCRSQPAGDAAIVVVLCRGKLQEMCFS